MHKNIRAYNYNPHTSPFFTGCKLLDDWTEDPEFAKEMADFRLRSGRYSEPFLWTSIATEGSKLKDVARNENQMEPRQW